MRIVLAADQSFVPAGHENPLAPGVWKKVLFQKADLQPGTVQMVNWARLPAGNTFSPHYHEDMQEIFIILRGEAQIMVDQQTVVLREGDSILIDAREVHRMWNTTREDVDYIAMGIAGAKNGRTVVVEGP